MHGDLAMASYSNTGFNQELAYLEKQAADGTQPSMQDVMWSLMFGTSDARLRAAREVRKLTKTSSKSRAYLAAAGVIMPLVAMLKSSCEESKEAAVLALLNLAVGNERNKLRIVKAGAIGPLVELLQSENLFLKESAAAAIYTLSAASVNKPLLGASGAISLLVDMVKSGSLQGKVDAVMALYNLSTYPDNLTPILAAGAVGPLLALLKGCKKSSKVAEKTTSLLKSLVAFEEGKSALGKEEGGILALVEVLEDGSLRSRENAVGTLLLLCESNRCRYRQAILQEGAIPGLLELTVQGSPRAQQEAHSLLRLLRDSSPRSSRGTSPSAMLESIVYDIASHMDGEEQGTETARKILTEMVQLSMEQNMRNLQKRAILYLPSDLSHSSCLTEVSSK
ncbi:hypothetical protein O6H91_14G041700 [Diphasiastrum complanatum]|uniref:Uncharacterized protein n=1 Tax=Diphasiastrum complanatum TaxID=34168 RepID=A0ACC2BNL1_DIPCM|nr:hypothetical protein O6H91_14G041700 [Diphasiastrum complanatum]